LIGLSDLSRQQGDSIKLRGDIPESHLIWKIQLYLCRPGGRC